MGTSGCCVYSQLCNGPIGGVKNSSSDSSSSLVQAAAADSWIDPDKRAPFFGYRTRPCEPEAKVCKLGQELLPGLVPSQEPAAYNCLLSSKCAFLSLLLPLASISPWLHLTAQYLLCASLSAHSLSLLSSLQAPLMLCCLFLPRTTRPHCVDLIHPCLGGWGSLCPRLMGLTIWDSTGPQRTMCVRGRKSM